MLRTIREKLATFGRGGGLARRRVFEFAQMMYRVSRKGSYYSRTFFCVPEKKVLYVSVSKAGNTSIKASMYALPEEEDYRAIHSEVKEIGESHSWAKVGNYADYYKFTFVRNPFDRLVSCYENKFHSDISSVGKSIKMLIYDWYLLGFLSKDRGFLNFARRVCMIPDKLSDRHFVSQSMSVVDKNGKLLLDYVGKLENMTEDYEPIRQKYGFQPLPHYNQTKKAKRNWMDYYDLKTARRVYKRYQTDIEAFGYQGAYDELVAYLKAKEVR